MTTSAQPSSTVQTLPPDRALIGSKLYALLIAFISAPGGLLFGYDLAIIGGANVFLSPR